ncbi:MAG TPA: hypothetical protein VLL48_12200, partial [Longimicrobiales bacterium]|nr:hypothetical protein [Longimicrobiales bacterium]
PSDPNTLFAAMYQRRRTAFGFSASGPGSGLYRTLDGGDTWEELTEGLPEGDKGRIGVDVFRGDGDLVYATVESSGEGRGLYRSRDRGLTWEKVSGRNPRPMYFSMVRIDPDDPERIYLGGVSLSASDDGGRTWWEGDAADDIHVDHHALWIDPADSDHLVLGNDGGIATSWDGARTWQHHDNLAIGQFYEIGVDMRDPYYVCGGLQDNSSWCAPSNSLTDYGIGNRDWYDVSGGDGFYNQIDPTDWRAVYTESQGGNVSRYDPLTGEEQDIRPLARPAPDGEDGEEREYDFNWNAPIVVSVHAPGTVYMGANHLMRSRDRGVTWEEASPDLTKDVDRDTLEIFGRPLSEPHLSRNDGISSYGTITTVDESPLDPDVLWVGTDDGNVQVTRDGGASWTNVIDAVPDVPARSYVSRVDASFHEAGRAYLAFDGHRNDDYRPWVFVTEDFGRSWRRITTGLPDHSVNVVREHPSTPGLLFVGNEVGVWVSVDRGATWTRLAAEGFPTVPVDDLVVHPRDNDLVIGTHGRSAWIVQDLTVLEEIATRQVLAAEVHLSEPGRATQWARKGGWPFWGDEYFADDPPDGALLRYWLRDGVAGEVVADGEGNGNGDPVDGEDGGEADPGPGAAADAAGDVDGTGGQEEDRPTVALTVLDAAGSAVRTLEAPGGPGLHTVVWDLRHAPAVEEDGPGQGGGGGRFGGPPAGPLVMPGFYTVRLEATGTTREVPLEVRVDPRVDVTRADLEARYEAAMSLHALAGPSSRAEDRLDEVSEQIDEVRELVAASDDAP